MTNMTIVAGERNSSEKDPLIRGGMVEMAETAETEEVAETGMTVIAVDRMGTIDWTVTTSAPR